MLAFIFMLEIGMGLSNGAVAAASRVRIAIAGVLGAGRLMPCRGGVWG